jgi:hypothetical protein
VNPSALACDETCYDGEEATNWMPNVQSFVSRKFKSISLEPSRREKGQGHKPDWGYSIRLAARRLSLTKESELLLWFSAAEVKQLRISIGKGSDVSGDIDVVIVHTHGSIQLRRQRACGLGLMPLINLIFSMKTEHIWIDM